MQYATGVLAVLTIAALSRAQTSVHVPDAQADKGPVNLVPLGGKASGQHQNLRTQIRVPKSFLPAAGSRITDLGFAAGAVGDYLYKSIEIRLAHLAGSGLGKTFAANLAGPVTVLQAKSFRYRFPKQDAFHLVGLKSGFDHDGKRDLVVEVTVQGAFFTGTSPGSRRSSTLDTVYALGYDAERKTPATGWGPFAAGAKLVLELAGKGIVYYGSGCRGSNGRVPGIAVSPQPKLGGRSTVRVTDALARTAGLLFVGTNDATWGALRLPFDLEPFGGKGCSVLTDGFVLVPVAVDAAGAGSVVVPFPGASSLRGARIHFQWLLADARANALGLVTSRAARAALE